MDRREARRKELAEKKKRLEELRRLKKERAAAKPPVAAVVAAPAVSAAPEPPGGLDSYIDELLSKPTPGAAPLPIKAETETTIDSSSPAAASSSSVPATSEAELRAARYARLAVSSGPEIHVPSRSVESYDKGTQTDGVLEEVKAVVEERPQSHPSSQRRPETPSDTEGVAGTDTVVTAPIPFETAVARTLDDAEREEIEAREEYSSFLAKSCRVVERALQQAEDFDVAVDYTSNDAVDSGKGQDQVSMAFAFKDARAKGRAVTDMRWSSHHKEMLLASYNKIQGGQSESVWRSYGSPEEPDGLVLLWSTQLREEPEFAFTCQSAVLTATFDPFSPHLVLGGTYSGQVVLWDMRAKSEPVQRSRMQAEGGHTHPVFAMEIVGTFNAHSLVTTSTDGQLCLWSTSDLSSPTDNKHLTWSKRDVAVTSLTFPTNDMNELCVGAEDGHVYRAQVHGSKAGIREAHSGHYGPVTSVSFHPSLSATNKPRGVGATSANETSAPLGGGSAALADLLLSSSMDWSVKLWSHRNTSRALHSFESATDYVYDVAWSPTHPALFAAVDGAGFLDIWNINADLEVPLQRTAASSEATYSRTAGEDSRAAAAPSSAGKTNPTALCAVHWAPDGRRVVTGDSDGTLRVFDVAAEPVFWGAVLVVLQRRGG